MNTHEVILNGRPLAIGRDYYKLLTMLISFEHHDEDGNRFTTHELRMEGIDAYGPVTQLIPHMRLKKGDVLRIVIGETPESKRVA